jgi:hypothetical protein
VVLGQALIAARAEAVMCGFRISIFNAARITFFD